MAVEPSLIDRINAIIKEIPESSLGPSTVQEHRKKMASYEPGKELSADSEYWS